MAKRRKRRSRSHRSRRSFGAATACSTTPRGTRSILGTVGGAVAGIASALGTFFLVTTHDRALQKAAGAPSPKPGVATGLAAAAAGAAGGFLGNRLAVRKPECR
jgi:hypothetical protein